MVRKSANIVVRFDRSAGAFYRSRFNHIRIDRTLCQPLDVTDLLRLLFKDFNEDPAYDFAFLFRIGNTFQLRQKTPGCIYTSDVQVHVTV